VTTTQGCVVTPIGRKRAAPATRQASDGPVSELTRAPGALGGLLVVAKAQEGHTRRAPGSRVRLSCVDRQRQRSGAHSPQTLDPTGPGHNNTYDYRSDRLESRYS